MQQNFKDEFCQTTRKKRIKFAINCFKSKFSLHNLRVSICRVNIQSLMTMH